MSATSPGSMVIKSAYVGEDGDTRILQTWRKVGEETEDFVARHTENFETVVAIEPQEPIE